MYSYVRNNPLIKTDPFGEESRAEIKSHTQTPIKKPLQKSVNNASNNNNDWSLLDNPIWNTVTNDALGFVTSFIEEITASRENIFGVTENRYGHFNSNAGRNVSSQIQSLHNATSIEEFYSSQFYQFGRINRIAGAIGKVLTPLGLISNSMSLYETWADPGNKSLPEKLADTAAAGVGLLSSFYGTASLFVGPVALPGGALRGASIAGTPALPALALLAGAFAGGMPSEF